MDCSISSISCLLAFYSGSIFLLSGHVSKVSREYRGGQESIGSQRSRGSFGSKGGQESKGGRYSKGGCESGDPVSRGSWESRGVGSLRAVRILGLIESLGMVESLGVVGSLGEDQLIDLLPDSQSTLRLLTAPRLPTTPILATDHRHSTTKIEPK